MAENQLKMQPAVTAKVGAHDVSVQGRQCNISISHEPS